MNKAILDSFFQKIHSSIHDDSFISLSLKNKRDKSSELKLINVRLIEIRDEMQLNMVLRYPTKDITKNYNTEEGLKFIHQQIQEAFYQADLVTKSKTYFFNSQHKTTLKEKNVTTESDSRSHDKQKNVALKNTHKDYLHQLDITSSGGHVIGKMRSKYNQINKYIEILDKVIQSSNLKDSYKIYDMGSGKAYLSFALYDHLKNTKNDDVVLTGIELRPALVDKCNKIAKDNKFSKLTFEQGYIGEKKLEDLDILIALHACDTATDDAIYQGIQSNASIIVCSPCCHKQVRKAMSDKQVPSITKHGILKERLAEMLTDTIRALLLEAHGYNSKVIEFISSEHTAKNLMLIGIKDNKHLTEEARQDKLKEVQNLKSTYGIQSHYLEDLLNA